MNSKIFFQTVFFVFFFSNCKKENSYVQNEDNSIFIKQEFLVNNQSISNWSTYIDTLFLPENHNSNSNIILSDETDKLYYEDYANSFFLLSDSIQQDSVSIIIYFNFLKRLKSQVSNKEDMRFSLQFKVKSNDISIRQISPFENFNFYFNDFNVLVNLLNKNSFQFLETNSNSIICSKEGCFEAIYNLGKNSWTSGSNATDTTNINQLEQYYFNVTNIDVNESLEKLYLSFEYNIPVWDTISNGNIKGKAKVVVFNNRQN